MRMFYTKIILTAVCLFAFAISTSSAQYYAQSPTTFGFSTFSSPTTQRGVDYGGAYSCNDDCFLGPIDIGFSFNFYGTSYNELYISTNGVVTFGGGNSNFSNEAIPDAQAPNNAIMVYQDFRFSNGNHYIRYETLGSSPNRIFVIEYFMSYFANNAINANFQIKIFENNNIEIHVASTSDPDQVTIGVENSTGSEATAAVNFLSQNITNSAWLFYSCSPGPTNQASGINQWDVRDVSMNLSWQRGNGSGCMVVVRHNSPISTLPFCSDTYSSFNSNFSSAPSLGDGKIVYMGTGSSMVLSGLSALQRYYIAVFEYSGDPTNGTGVYKLSSSSNNPKNIRTARFKQVDDYVVTSEQVTSFFVGSVSPNPAFDKINFEIETNSQAEFTTEILDLTGKSIIVNKHNLNQGIFNINIPIDELSSGFYLIKISNGLETLLENFSVIK